MGLLIYKKQTLTKRYIEFLFFKIFCFCFLNKQIDPLMLSNYLRWNVLYQKSCVKGLTIFAILADLISSRNSFYDFLVLDQANLLRKRRFVQCLHAARKCIRETTRQASGVRPIRYLPTLIQNHENNSEIASDSLASCTTVEIPEK